MSQAEPASPAGNAEHVSAPASAGRSSRRLGLPDRPSSTWIVDAAVILIVLSLLGGLAGIAILIAVFVVPFVALRFLTELDLFEREPWFGVGGAMAAGILAGIFVGAVNQFFVDEFWIENAPLNVGAAGFGGRFADADGGPPALIMLLSGFVMPVIAIGLQLLVPVYLRRWPMFRNEVMDGVTMGAAAGFGFAAATAIYYYWPFVVDDTNPRVALEDWTATLIGLAVVRPLLFGTFTALVGAGVWQYAMMQRSSELTLPVILGLGGAMLYSIGDLLVQPTGARWELLWAAIVLVVLLFISFRLVLRRALRFDLHALGGPGQRTVCPHCGRVTPIGTYCANCGNPLTTPPAASDAEATPATVAPTEFAEQQPTPPAHDSSA